MTAIYLLLLLVAISTARFLSCRKPLTVANPNSEDSTLRQHTFFTDARNVIAPFSTIKYIGRDQVNTSSTGRVDENDGKMHMILHNSATTDIHDSDYEI